jgi:hypothetical protein
MSIGRYCRAPFRHLSAAVRGRSPDTLALRLALINNYANVFRGAAAACRARIILRLITKTIKRETL